jgi:hypothetical protein
VSISIENYIKIGQTVFGFKQEKHIFKGYKNGVKDYSLKFFLHKGVLGTHKMGFAEFAPFWMKNNCSGTPWKKL